MQSFPCKQTGGRLDLVVHFRATFLLAIHTLHVFSLVVFDVAIVKLKTHLYCFTLLIYIHTTLSLYFIYQFCHLKSFNLFVACCSVWSIKDCLTRE